MERGNSRQRRKILDAAIMVFAGHGLAGATTRMLARQAGVNSALIYYYFENKQALFAEAIQTVLQRFFDSLRSHPAPFHTGHDRVAFLVNSIFNYFAVYPERIRLVTIAFHLHPELFGQAVQALIARQFPYPLQVLRDGVARRQLRPMHPLQGWWHIVGACLFSLNLRKIMVQVETGAAQFSFPDPKNQRQAIIETLVRGLAPDPIPGHSRSADA